MTAIAAHRSFLADIQARQSARRAAIDPSYSWTTQPNLNHGNAVAGPSGTWKGVDYISKANVANYIPEEESVRNDYAAWYGASGEWGSNFVLGADEGQVCEEFPALKKLMDLKIKLVDSVAHPPLYLTLPAPDQNPAPGYFGTINTALTQSLGSNRFDAILITPPPTATWDDIASLPLRALSADPGFVFLWVGPASGDGLERGRETFAKWGFRRAEDIVWVKTNKGRGRAEDGMAGEPGGGVGERAAEERVQTGRDQGGLFVGQKEHCLMGIRGTVRRSTDGRFVHCNVDTDIMLWEDDRDIDGPRHPPYLQTLIENFCLGTRRLHLFGTPSDSRRGWVTAGTDDLSVHIESSQANIEAFNAETYPSSVHRAEDGRPILPYEAEVDNLRPKSPVRKSRNLPGQNQRDNNIRNVRPNGPPRFNPQHAQQSPMSPPQMYGMGQPSYSQQQQQQQMPVQHGGYGQMSFGQQQQQQFDPSILAHAQAHAQAQMMQMQMMMQMQAQAQMQAQMQGMMMGNAGMGMGLGMQQGMGVNQSTQQGMGVNQGMGMGMGMHQGMGATQGMSMNGMGMSMAPGIGQGPGLAGANLGVTGMAPGVWQNQTISMGRQIAPAPMVPPARIEYPDQGEDEEMVESWQAGE